MATQKNSSDAAPIDFPLSDRLLASLPVGIVYQNAAGEILAANPAAERILGLSTSQLRGITSIDPRWQAVRADGSPFPGAEHPAMAALRSGQAVRDVRFGVFNPALGKTTWINVSAFPIRGDGADAVTGVYALFEDISGFRQQQDQLRLQGLVLDQIEDRVTVTDLDGMVVYVNQTEARALGFAREDLVGKHVSVFGESPEADATQQEIVDQTMTKGSWQGKVVNNAANGSRHILNLRTALVRDEAGKPVALAGIGTDITEQDRAERIERQYQSVIQASIDGFWIVDAAARILDANDAMCRMLGYTREELLGMSIPDIEADESAADTAAHIREMMTIGHVQFEARHKRKDGTVIDVEVSALYVASQGDRFFTFVRDITERKQMDQQLRIAATAFETQEGMLISDRDNVVLRVNQAFTDITGYSAGDVVGKTPSLLRSGRHDAAFYERMWQSLQDQDVWQGEIWNRRKNGEVYPEWLTITTVKDRTGEVANYVATLTDITQRKAAEDEIKHLAFYDPLTQLPNRRLLLDRLQQALTSSARHNRHGALLLLDMDDFKSLNDTLGHDVGDRFLVEVARRLETCVREGDTVARQGGDEFVVILEDLSEDAVAATQAESVAVKILRAILQPYQLGLSPGREPPTRAYHCSVSIGITLFRGSSLTVDELMKRADTAMYQAKAAGRNTLRFYDPEMQRAVSARAVMDNDLREAVQMGQFVLYYQPQVDERGNMTGAEALLRWQHPERGMVSPAHFIPLAEESGLILPIGHWVLESACTQLVAWSTRPGMSHLSVAVNVSARQFRSPDFVDQVSAVLDRTGADPQKLKLELTESLLLDNVEDTIAKMVALKARGVGFSLDDFGTGYSSLAYLKLLPLDQLKIDQSFVRDILTDPNDAAIARTIVALAQSMGLGVIAEGVESMEQQQFLAKQTCHAFQGYLFGRPMPAEEFERLLRRGAVSAAFAPS